jgi:short subunit fatty acids transporter
MSVSSFRKRLYANFRRNAEGLDGALVVDALYQASEDVWHAGIDDAYASLKNSTDETLADAFDISWLTVVSIRLAKLAKGHGRTGEK